MSSAKQIFHFISSYQTFTRFSFTVGPGGVGKSALALQYVQQLFVDTYDPTIQDNYRKKVNIQGKWYTLDILDTAGQDEFSALRSQYMANYEAFLLVCSVTSVPSLVELRDFYKEIYRVIRKKV